MIRIGPKSTREEIDQIKKLYKPLQETDLLLAEVYKKIWQLYPKKSANLLSKKQESQLRQALNTRNDLEPEKNRLERDFRFAVFIYWRKEHPLDELSRALYEDPFQQAFFVQIACLECRKFLDHFSRPVN
jgi:hypothetical protein